MKTLVILLLLFRVALADEKTGAVYSHSEQIQRVFNGSQRLRQLLAKTKAGRDYAIEFDENANPASIYQGFTEIDGHTGRLEFRVHIIPGLSDEFVENLLAHEIFHIYLRSEGFLFDSADIPRKRQLEGTKELAFIEDATMAMANCYVDAIIDRRMESLGYDPRILNQRKREEMMRAGEEQGTIAGSPQLVNLYKRYVAVVMYCTSLRLRDFDMRDIYAANKLSDWTLERDVAEISRQMGPDPCETGKTCFQEMLKLRKASGFDGEAKFQNPWTGKFE